MTDAPERIWAWQFHPREQNDVMIGGWFPEPSRGNTEYVRADMHDAALARVVELERALRLISHETYLDNIGDRWQTKAAGIARAALDAP